MMKFAFLMAMTCLVALTSAAVHFPQYDARNQIRQGVAGAYPYTTWAAPNGRFQSVLQAIEANDGDNFKSPISEIFDNEDEELDNEVEDITEDVNDNDEANNDHEEQLIDDEEVEDNSEEEENDELNNFMNFHLNLRKSYSQTKNAKPSQHAAGIMIPDKVIETEAKIFLNEKTGKVDLLLPRTVLDSIPDGSVVALMENIAAASNNSEGRANRVIVLRRRKGARRTAANKRPNNYRRRNVIVVRRGNIRNVYQRRNNRRRVYLQA